MSTSRQQAVPSQQPQPLAPRPPPVQKIGQTDMFVNMIGGPVISVGIGLKENFRTFVLPCRLLAQHSLYVHNCLHPTQSSSESTNKRKASQVSCEEGPAESKARNKGADVVIKIESDTDENETKEEKEGSMAHILLPDVDPMIFGLFLHFIYKDGYPHNVDAHLPMAANQVPQVPHPHPSVSLPSRTESAKRPRVSPGLNSSTDIPSTSTAAHHGSRASTTNANSKAADKHALPILAPWPAPIPSTSSPSGSNPIPLLSPVCPPQIIHPSVLFSHIPTSVQAHFLGYRLGACAFINYTMTRIHSAIGTSLRLTPWVVHTIWEYTRPLSHAPLRRLVIDYLVTYWSQPNPSVRGARISPDQHLWEILFDHCKDLRNEFLRGIQNRAVVAGPEAYYITKKMMVDSNWERLGRVLQGVASPSPSPSPGPGPDAGASAGEGMKGTA